MGKNMSAYRSIQAPNLGKDVKFRDKLRVGLLETVGSRIPFSLAGCQRLVVEPTASDNAKARSARKIIELGEVDELIDLLPKAPLYMQRDVAEKLVWRIEREISHKEVAESYALRESSLYKVKTAKEYEAEWKLNIQKLLLRQSKDISLEAISILNDFINH
jgi:hypothetical protein